MRDIEEFNKRKHEADLAGMARVIEIAMASAFQVRQAMTGEEANFAQAHKMAGELGQALFGLNTWTEDDDEAGAQRAADCREVHRRVCQWAFETIYNKQEA